MTRLALALLAVGLGQTVFVVGALKRRPGRIGIIGYTIGVLWVWLWPNTERSRWWYPARHRDGVNVWRVIASVRAQAAHLAEQMYEHRTQWLEVAT